ncbi:class I SAM-dependent methyltransferase [Winogradskyella aurantiaca]|uniref:SAM-dependent methyltransferase n=1 Tax=Winogradskyella aurantiaca TaxID=2219558 RepID=UPI000E1DE5DD|nr:SAM-dependent methyltransferase [Winogradskyella aurantiaca]
MTNDLENYWNNRYLNNHIGWDLGKPSQPLTTYIDGLKDYSLRILIPGAGNSYEVDYLWSKGFRNLNVVDVAEFPLQQLKKRLPEFSSDHLLRMDFFNHTGQYDLILEQTFFCAINPKLREDYRDHVYRLLKPGGKLVGLLFDFPLSSSGPPFGGDSKSYTTLFIPKFKVKTLERAYNSEPSRAGKELFFIFDKN